MTTQHDKAKRWRPWRFSVRTLAIVVTLVCVVLALWLATNDRGIADVNRVVKDLRAEGSRVVLPLVVEVESESAFTLLHDALRQQRQRREGPFPEIVTGVQYQKLDGLRQRFAGWRACERSAHA